MQNLLNRKILAYIAVNDSKSFDKITEEVRKVVEVK